MAGWRYVNVAVAHVSRPVLLNVGMWQNTPGSVKNLAVDFCELVPLHDDVFRMETRFDPVDVHEPAAVEYLASVHEGRLHVNAGI